MLALSFGGWKASLLLVGGSVSHKPKASGCLLAEIQRFLFTWIHPIPALSGHTRRQIMGPRTLSKEADASYEEAVKALNTLQSNAAYLEKTKAERDRKRHLSLPQTIATAERVGLTLDDLDKLAVIHISGTKGKGSTCAFSESILSNHGYKTGFFSSPHLVEVRERMRINGKPISKDLFSSYFWACYRRLEASKDKYDGDMPTYFRFLTIMAFHVFIKEKVDVAIIEVGIGGEYDCTNIVRNPVVCGVTSLGIDHTSLLGNTLDQIAWHKAGIFKSGVPAVTVPQPENSIQVLIDRAYEKGCPLYIVPESVYDYDGCGDHDFLGIPGAKQSTNASLAVQLCSIWMKNHEKNITDRKQLYVDYINRALPKANFFQDAEKIKLSEPMVKGLANCYWPGRCEILARPGITFYLDGAHTPRSIDVCAQWFKDASHRERKMKCGKIVSILLFNTTGDRKPASLLEHLLDCHFDVALFCPNITSNSSSSKADQTNYMVTNEMQLAKCEKNQKAWIDLVTSSFLNGISVNLSENGNQDCDGMNEVNGHHNGHGNADDTSETVKGNFVSDTCSRQNDSRHVRTEIFSSIEEALQWIKQSQDCTSVNAFQNSESSELLQSAKHVQVLCTGSLHLVGGILALLDPDISDK